MPITVSVIIPTYNHASYLGGTLTAVFTQTFTDYEVIVINDGSPDDTAAVVQPYVRDRRVRYVEQANVGQAAARNKGLGMASGDFIAFLDDDDLWPADSLEWRVTMLQAHPEWAAVAGRVAFMNGGEVDLGQVGPCVPELTFDGLFDGNPINSPGQVLVRTSALRAAGGLDATIWGADDWDLLFRLTRQGPVRMYDRVALRYRVHAGNATHQGRRLYLGSLRTVRRQLATVADRQRRRVLVRAGYTFLYNAWADRLGADARRALRWGRLGTATRSVLAAARMLRSTRDLPWMPVGLFVRIVLPSRVQLKLQHWPSHLWTRRRAARGRAPNRS